MKSGAHVHVEWGFPVLNDSTLAWRREMCLLSIFDHVGNPLCFVVFCKEAINCWNGIRIQSQGIAHQVSSCDLMKIWKINQLMALYWITFWFDATSFLLGDVEDIVLNLFLLIGSKKGLLLWKVSHGGTFLFEFCHFKTNLSRAEKSQAEMGWWNSEMLILFAALAPRAEGFYVVLDLFAAYLKAHLGH